MWCAKSTFNMRISPFLLHWVIMESHTLARNLSWPPISSPTSDLQTRNQILTSSSYKAQQWAFEDYVALDLLQTIHAFTMKSKGTQHTFCLCVCSSSSLKMETRPGMLLAGGRQEFTSIKFFKVWTNVFFPSVLQGSWCPDLCSCQTCHRGQQSHHVSKPKTLMFSSQYEY